MCRFGLQSGLFRIAICAVWQIEAVFFAFRHGFFRISVSVSSLFEMLNFRRQEAGDRSADDSYRAVSPHPSPVWRELLRPGGIDRLREMGDMGEVEELKAIGRLGGIGTLKPGKPSRSLILNS